mgnify:CR=1 FL=1
MERFNETQVLEIKAAISAAAAALSAWLGWFGWLAVIYLACMVVDYITGSAAAGKSGVWSSAAAREGIWHKAGSIVAVAASLLTDILIGLVVNHLPAISLPFQYTVLFCPVVIVWYILTELGSIVENAGAMGAPIPAFLQKLILVCKNSVDAAGDRLMDDEKEERK